MRKKILSIAALIVLSSLFGADVLMDRVYAEEDLKTDTTETSSTSISLMPVSKILQIASNSVYEDKMTVNNDGNAPMRIEVYAAPYSYVYSENEDSYKLGFNSDNNFTQIARWITFRGADDKWAAKTTYEIAPNDSVDVHYRITTPDNIPGGGQYAVIFAHTLSSSVSASGIRTEASPGMVVYGRSSEGEVVVKPIISDLEINYGTRDKSREQNSFFASAKVKNEGNVDFNAIGKMKIQSIFGDTVYETVQPSGIVSIIPDAELVVADEWTNSPLFGIYKVTWTVTVGEETEAIERVIFANAAWFLIISITLLTILVIGSIIMLRRRRERRSRLAV